MGISILRGGIMVEGVGIIGVGGEEIEVGMGVETSGEEIVGMERVSSCGIKECGDIGVI